MPNGCDRLQRQMRSGAAGYRCVNATAGKHCWSLPSGTPETPLPFLAAAVHSVAVLRRCIICALHTMVGSEKPRCTSWVMVQRERRTLRWAVACTAEEGGQANLSVGCAGMCMSLVRVGGSIVLASMHAGDRAVGDWCWAGVEPMTELQSRDEVGARKEPEWGQWRGGMVVLWKDTGTPELPHCRGSRMHEPKADEEIDFTGRKEAEMVT
ncbi:hypothetical protein DFH08DRAFT_993340 [Mycena albidolilacea]|uniref:Uncharacterized protein n=1 Tax=Mycena albidolilacea TaxID=1033008 RepID=A0AAD7A8X7_9AGAR|nr:hypothetical protein DFH08DRAFT_993340 [Mycena albidolilacea]